MSVVAGWPKRAGGALPTPAPSESAGLELDGLRELVAARAHGGDEVGRRFGQRRVAMPREADLPCGHTTGGLEGHDSRDARVDRKARNERGSDARRHHALHGAALVAAEHDVRL